MLPKSLRPLIKAGGETIEHDRSVFSRAMKVNLYIDELREDERLQIYRTALDTLLSWLSATNSAIERKLYTPADIEDAGYWLRKVCETEAVVTFINEYGYMKSLAQLAKHFGFEIPMDNKLEAAPKTFRRGGFGSSWRGGSVGG